MAIALAFAVDRVSRCFVRELEFARIAGHHHHRRGSGRGGSLRASGGGRRKRQARAAGHPYANLPAFCRVAFTIKPSSADSDIKIEIWMPATGWNNKFEAEGNGAWTGSITQNTLAAAVRRWATRRP